MYFRTQYSSIVEWHRVGWKREKKGASLYRLPTTDCSPAEIPWPLFFTVGVVVPPKIAKGIRTNYVDRRLLESSICVGINNIIID